MYFAYWLEFHRGGSATNRTNPSSLKTFRAILNLPSSLPISLAGVQKQVWRPVRVAPEAVLGVAPLMVGRVGVSLCYPASPTLCSLQKQTGRSEAVWLCYQGEGAAGRGRKGKSHLRVSNESCPQSQDFALNYIQVCCFSLDGMDIWFY